MKRILIIIILITCSVQISTAQESRSLDNSNLETSTVYFMSKISTFVLIGGFSVFIDDNMVCKLNDKHFSMHNLEQGKHKFTVQFAGKKSKSVAEPIYIEVEPGKNYYINLVMQTGFFKNNIYCQEITKNSANPILMQLTEDPNCKVESEGVN